MSSKILSEPASLGSASESVYVNHAELNLDLGLIAEV